MKAMAGQVWRLDGIIVVISPDFAYELNTRLRVLSRTWVISRVFEWHNEHSEGEWNNFGCGFTILKAERKVKPKKVESN